MNDFKFKKGDVLYLAKDVMWKVDETYITRLGTGTYRLLSVKNGGSYYLFEKALVENSQAVNIKSKLARLFYL